MSDLSHYTLFEFVPQRVENINFYALKSVLTPEEWVALDFSNSEHSVRELSEILPISSDALFEAFDRLVDLELIRVERADDHDDDEETMRDLANHLMVPIKDREFVLSLIPRSLHGGVEKYSPRLLDISLEIDSDVQWVLEFLDENIENISDEEILGIEVGANQEAIHRGYIKRSKQFHPDRYFRKNIGPFRDILSRINIVLSNAYSRLAR